MKGRRHERIELIRAVEGEYRVVALALSMLRTRLSADPAGLKPHRLSWGNFERAMANLGATYVTRMFAEFEAGLREAWARKYRQTTEPRAADLLSAFQARCRIPQDLYDAVEDVRKYRNSIVHDQDEAVAAVSVDIAGRHLRTFLSKLPVTW
jgi:hypothetical protein